MPIHWQPSSVGNQYQTVLGQEYGMDLFVLPLVQQGYLNSCRPVCWLLSCSWGKRRYCFKQQYVWLSVPGDCQNHTADSDIHINLFSSYLQNRRQRCLVNCHLSYENAIKCGVPQGSILGPLLFLIFINDLPNCLKSAIPSMYHVCWWHEFICEC